MATPRALGAFVLIATLILAVVTTVALASRPAAHKCDAARVASLAEGLSYAEGYRAALVTQHADTRTADENAAATQSAVDACPR